MTMKSDIVAWADEKDSQVSQALNGDIGEDRIKISGMPSPVLQSGLTNRFKQFNILPSNTSIQNDAAISALESMFSGEVIDGLGNIYSVTSIPSGNIYKNCFFSIDGYEGGLRVLIPAKSTLERKKTTLISTSGHTSWPQDGGWYWNGIKGVTYTSSNHQTGNRFQSFSQRGSIDHWESAVPDFGRDQNDAPNGFWSQGGCVIKGVEFVLVRRQGAGSGYPTDHRIYARNLSRRTELNDIVQSRSGSTKIRIYKSDADDLEVIENSKVKITCQDTIGGRSIDALATCNANNSLFMEFDVGGSSFTSTEIGGGFTQIVIDETPWVERTFSGGASLGEALVANGGDDGNLTGQPAVCMSLAPISGDLSGSCYLSAGAGYGMYIVKVSNLMAGVNEASLDFVKKAAFSGWAEPTLTVSEADENVVYVGLRSDDPAKSPAIAITTDAFATMPIPVEISGSGGWALDSPIPGCVSKSPSGEEFVFFGATGNRGGASDGWSTVDVYMMAAKQSDLLASGAPALDVYAVGDVNWFDMFGDTGPSGRSGVGVGTMISLPGSRVEFVLGDMKPNGSNSKPQVDIVSYMIDVSSITRGVPHPVVQTADVLTGGYLEWTGLSGDIVGPNIFAPTNFGTETYGDALGVDGIFTVPVTGRWICDVSIMLNGTGSEQYAYLWDEDAGTFLSPPAFSGDLNPEFRLVRANLPVGTNMSVYGSCTFYLTAGQRISVRLPSGTTAKVTSIQNMIRWRSV